MPKFDRRPNKDKTHTNDTGRRPQCRKKVGTFRGKPDYCGNPLLTNGQCPTHGTDIN